MICTQRRTPVWMFCGCWSCDDRKLQAKQEVELIINITPPPVTDFIQL